MKMRNVCGDGVCDEMILENEDDDVSCDDDACRGVYDDDDGDAYEKSVLATMMLRMLMMMMMMKHHCRFRVHHFWGDSQCEKELRKLGLKKEEGWLTEIYEHGS